MYEGQFNKGKLCYKGFVVATSEQEARLNIISQMLTCERPRKEEVFRVPIPTQEKPDLTRRPEPRDLVMGVVDVG